MAEQPLAEEWFVVLGEQQLLDRVSSVAERYGAHEARFQKPESVPVSCLLPIVARPHIRLSVSLKGQPVLEDTQHSPVDNQIEALAEVGPAAMHSLRG